MNLGWFRGWRRFRRTAGSDHHRVLLRAIQQLPLECRDVFVLHRFEGRSLDEIAAHLRIDPAVAEARLAEALVQLCRAIEEAKARQSSERS
ncbi:RNA polymerase sigma factor [Brevundimonas faecalis]|uniref:RNA polymerase sigma factor n=1 Tax=Brevundimonas faecalis TaxID=947378 RepID=UPI00362423E7